MPWSKIKPGIIAIIACFILLNTIEVKGDEAEWDTYTIKQNSIIYENISSSIYYVTENITIDEGETYIFDNATVIFNTSYDGSLSIVMGNGGTLIIRNNCLLTINRTGNYSNNHGYNYNIISQKGSALRIADSKILYSGYDEQFSSGVVIESDHSRIINTTFIHSSNAIFLNNCNYSLIEGCSFSQIEKNGIQMFGWSRYLKPFWHNHTISNCYFTDVKLNCIELGDFNNNELKKIYIINNIMINSSNGIYFFPWEYLFVWNNEFINMSGMAIDGRYGGSLYYLEVINNLIDNCSNGIIGLTQSFTNISNNIIKNIKEIGIKIYPRPFGHNTKIINNTLSHVNEGLVCYYYTYYYSLNSIIKSIKIDHASIGVHFVQGIIKIIEPVFNNCSNSIYLERVTNDNIANLFFNNDLNAIKMVGCDRTNISDCVFKGSNKAISISGSKDIVFFNNSFKENEIAMESDPGSRYSLMQNSYEDNDIAIKSNGSKIIKASRNNFFDNGIQVIDNSSIVWNDTAYGNYWSGIENYSDWDGDGIVDNPVTLDHDSIDHRPLIVPWGQPWNRRVRLDDIATDYRINSGEWVNLTFTATDPDKDVPFFDIKSSRIVDFQFDKLTGVFSFRGVDEFAGITRFNITALDGNGSRDWSEFSIGVNRFPVPEPIPEIVSYPNYQVRQSLNVSDPDGDDVTLSVVWTDTPFEISVKFGNLLWFKSGPNDSGLYKVTIQADDGNGSLRMFDVIVRIIPFNLPPAIDDIELKQIYAEEESRYQVIAHDPNPDILTYEANYTGIGTCSISVSGELLIIPDVEDVGEQWVHLNVSDNNGSYAEYYLRLEVLLRNKAPVGPGSISIIIECGDTQIVHLNVTDPEGGPVTISNLSSFPDWIRIISKELHISPVLEDVGNYDLQLRCIDQLGDHYDIPLRIEVIQGRYPAVLIPGSVQIKENQVKELILDTDYSMNGTISYTTNNTLSWIGLSNGILRIAPKEGDWGDYSIGITASIIGGVHTDVSLDIAVEKNLSRLGIRIEIEPQKWEYHAGDRISLNLWYYDYGGELELSLHISLEGEEIYFESGRYHEVELTDPGIYEFWVSVDGKKVSSSEIIEVLPKKDERPMVWPFYLAGILVLIVCIIILALYLKRRYTPRLATVAYKASDPILEGE